MTGASSLLSHLEADHFEMVLAASPKKFREEIFRKAGIRNRGGAFALKAGAKNSVRVQKLRENLLKGKALDEDLAEEVIRNYFFTRRSLLAEALDFLEVNHDEGLTDDDLDFVNELPKERIEKLKGILEQNHDQQDVELYLRFMNVPL